MNNNRYKVILLIVLVVAIFFARVYHKRTHYHFGVSASQKQDSIPSSASSSTSEHQTAIDPSTKLIFTHHAQCRMDCRHITEADIREVLREGHINEAKSQQNESPCPTYAIEDDRNSDGVRLRIVFAKCDDITKVVTCIDRDHEYECECK